MTEIVYKGKFLTVVRKKGWEYVKRNTNSGNIVSVLPITSENEVILVEQFRIPVDKYVLECPAGVLGDDIKNEVPLDCAKKELQEETGYVSDDWQRVYTSPKSPGIITETDYKYVARNCKKVADGGGVGTEDITVHKIPLDNIKEYLSDLENDRDILVSSGIYAGLYFI